MLWKSTAAATANPALLLLLLLLLLSGVHQLLCQTLRHMFAHPVGC
jgi:hypothetical protein